MRAGPTFYEFFAGGGMARAGLGDGWTCLFANDFDAKKGASYVRNWGAGGELKIGDVHQVGAADLAGQADLAWASFPCQDLSLAGVGAGLKGARSGTFFPFWRVMRELGAEGRAPKIVALENVCGALTSHQGRDFAGICDTFVKNGYRVGALVIDAALFVPQSRPRLFFVGIRDDAAIAPGLLDDAPSEPFHPRNLRTAYEALPRRIKERWLWWRASLPLSRNASFADLVEQAPKGVAWHTRAETQRLLSLMSPVNRAKIIAAQGAGRRMVGTAYRRTRRDEAGEKIQRVEARFDDVAGCLRTPAGGSSRQILLVVDGPRIRSRLISARESARLMGLPDDYILPEKYNEAYHLTGDGVAAPVVRHLANVLFEPLLDPSSGSRAAA